MVTMPTYEFKYGPRPEGGGYGIISESDAIESADRESMINFCKAIRWRPEKLDSPGIVCMAIVPAPDVFWLCHIDETTDDKNRKLALLVQAEGFLRFDDKAISKLQSKLLDEIAPDEFSPNLQQIEEPLIVTHADLLSYLPASSGKRNVQPSTQPNQSFIKPARESVQTPTTLVSKRKNHRGYPMKSVIVFFLGVIASTVTLWFGIIQPADQESARYKKAVDVGNQQIIELKDEISGWEKSAKKHFPEITNPDGLSARIASLLSDLRKKEDIVEISRLNYTEVQLEHLRAMLEANKLLESLQKTSQAIDSLRQNLPTSQNINPSSETNGRKDENSGHSLNRLNSRFNRNEN